MSEQIVLLGNATYQFGFPHIVTRDLYHAFRRRSIRVAEFPVHTESVSRYASVPAEEIAFNFLMNYSKRFLDEIKGAPFLHGKTISWQQDNPYVVANRVLGGGDDQHWYCADRYAIDHAPLYYWECASVGHLPHWATDYGLSLGAETEIPFDQRSYDVLFVGSVDVEGIEFCKEQVAEGPAPLRALAKLLIDKAMAGACKTLMHEALEEETGFGREFAQLSFQAFCNLLRYVDKIVRNLRRIELLRALSGMKIAVVTDDYAKIRKYLGDGLIELGKADFLTGLKAMENAKIVINNLPLYKMGATERVFNAQLRGAAVLSEGNEFLREVFVEDESILLYDPCSDLNFLRDRLADLVAGEGLATIAAAGQTKTKENHLADHRVEEILRSHPVS